MFFYSKPLFLDPYINNVSLLLRGAGVPGSTILDESSNSHSITINGNATLSSAEKKYGTYSMQFDGNGDHLEISDASSLELGGSDFTIETWVRFTQLKGYQGIISKNSSPSDGSGWALGMEADQLVFAAGNGSWSTFLYSGVFPTINTWYHVAITRQGNLFTFWVDGQSRTTGTDSIVINDGNLPLYVARYPYFPSANPSQDLSGYIDDLRITKGVARYTSNFTPPGELQK